MTGLGGADFLWFCLNCDQPNDSDLINDMFTVPIGNAFEAINYNTWEKFRYILGALQMSFRETLNSRMICPSDRSAVEIL